MAVLHDGRFDPAERLRLCEELGVNVLCQAPTEYRMLAKRGELAPVPGLRRLVSAGRADRGRHDPVSSATSSAWRSPTAMARPRRARSAASVPGEDDPARDGSMGRPLPGLETRVRRRRAAAAGRILPHLLRSLPRRRAASTASGGRPATGSARTATGGLWFEGRNDDLILSSGYRIGPFEVESALVSHPAVVEAAAVAAPDPERGSVVRAIVVLRDGAGSLRAARRASFRSTSSSQTAPYKYPRIVEFAAELPKTNSGKIRRAELREN